MFGYLYALKVNITHAIFEQLNVLHVITVHTKAFGRQTYFENLHRVDVCVHDACGSVDCEPSPIESALYICRSASCLC